MRSALRILMIMAAAWGLARLVDLAPQHWKNVLTWLPPALITLLVAFAFGLSLFRGEALITRIAREYHVGELPDDLVAYSRRLTGVWTAFLLACAILTVFLVQFVHLPHAAMLTPVMVAALMIGEYFFRKFRFSQHAHPNPLAVMWLMLLNGMPRK